MSGFEGSGLPKSIVMPFSHIINLKKTRYFKRGTLSLITLCFLTLGMNRRAALEPICTHSWKWFDVGTGKWCTYAQPNNKTIDDAFWAGDSSVRIQHSRKKYIIQFGTMMQVRVWFFNMLL